MRASPWLAIAASLVIVASAAPYHAPHIPSRSRPTSACYIPDAYQRPVIAACYEFGVPVWLAASLIRRESGWSINAYNRNRDGSWDYGLMQLNSRYFDPKLAVSPEAIRVGIEHLASLHDATGDWRLALVAYNAGLRAVRQGRAPGRAWQYASDILAGG